MQEQNFKNHTRMVPLFHYGTFGAIVVLLVLGIVSLFMYCGENMILPIWATLATLVMVSLGWFARQFAIKAQDRAIRAEEQLRYFILAGERMDTRTRMGQIIALRFASDEEFVALAKRAVAEQMKATDIKKAIQNWRADHHRA